MVASLTIIISYLGALVVVLTSPGRVREIRWIALITTILGLATAICCATRRVADTPAASTTIWTPKPSLDFAQSSESPTMDFSPSPSATAKRLASPSSPTMATSSQDYA